MVCSISSHNSLTFSKQRPSKRAREELGDGSVADDLETVNVNVKVAGGGVGKR
jgi:hypothetical protein